MKLASTNTKKVDKKEKTIEREERRKNESCTEGETSHPNLDNWCADGKKRNREQASNPATLAHLVTFCDPYGLCSEPILLHTHAHLLLASSLLSLPLFVSLYVVYINHYFQPKPFFKAVNYHIVHFLFTIKTYISCK